MGADVKGGAEDDRRAYDARGRRERALATRRRILLAARGRFEERGFAATTMADVARLAGVSPESVYQRFGSKAALVKEVFDVAVAGDDEPVAVADRPESDRIREEGDVRAKVRAYARGAVQRARRTARVQLALRDGATLDPGVREIWEQLQSERLRGTRMFAEHLVGTGGLRAGLRVEDVGDVIWTCVSVEVYDLLVLQRGWSHEAYGDWLARTLIASTIDR